MKFPKILVVLGLVLFTSCQKDENEDAIQLISRHWHIWNYEPASDSPVEESLLAKEAILKLVEVGCDPIEFTFKEDRSVRYKTGLSYLAAQTSENGVEVSCAPSYDDLRGTFDYDMEELNINLEGKSLKIMADIDGEFLYMNFDDLTFNGTQISGKLIFKEETGE